MFVNVFEYFNAKFNSTLLLFGILSEAVSRSVFYIKLYSQIKQELQM